MTIENRYQLINDLSLGNDNFKIDKAVGLGLGALAYEKMNIQGIEEEKCTLTSMLVSDGLRFFPKHECCIVGCDLFDPKTWRTRKNIIDKTNIGNELIEGSVIKRSDFVDEEKGIVRVYTSFSSIAQPLDKTKIKQVYNSFNHVHFLLLAKSDIGIGDNIMNSDWLDGLPSNIYENRFSKRIFDILSKSNSCEIAVMGEFDDPDLFGLIIGKQNGLLQTPFSRHCWSSKKPGT